MKSSKFEGIKAKLLERKSYLEQELTRLSREQVGESQVPDPGDQAALSTLEDLNISLHNNEMREYAMIRQALRMIDEGTYGACIDCSQPIAERRLQLYPNATRCLGCQEALEERG